MPCIYPGVSNDIEHDPPISVKHEDQQPVINVLRCGQSVVIGGDDPWIWMIDYHYGLAQPQTITPQVARFPLPPEESIHFSRTSDALHKLHSSVSSGQ